MSEREPRSSEQPERAKSTQSDLKEIAKQAQTEKKSADTKSEAQRQQAIDKAREQLKQPETQSEKAAEKQAETQSEKTEQAEKTERKAEKNQEKPQEKSQETKAAQSTGRRARKQAYDHTMELVRSRLSPSEQIFSRVVHSRPVEYASELLEETFYRPSFLLGGTIGALIFGGALYISARLYGFQLSGSEFTLGIIGGGLVGFVFEKILRIGHKAKK